MVRRFFIQVTGLVQGVFFRHTAKQTATSLDLVGFARNEADGSVYIEVQGGEKALSQFVNWAHVGSPSSQVESVKVYEMPTNGDKSFTILEV